MFSCLSENVKLGVPIYAIDRLLTPFDVAKFARICFHGQGFMLSRYVINGVITAKNRKCLRKLIKDIIM